MNEKPKGESGAPKKEERRSRPREKKSIPVVLSADHQPLAKGAVINLSDRGIFLITEVGDVKIGDTVNVKLQLGGDEQEWEGRIVEAQARVVRVEDLSGLALYLSKDLEAEPEEE